MIVQFLLLLLPVDSASHHHIPTPTEDSIIIYQAYKTEIPLLATIASMQDTALSYQLWHQHENEVDSITTCSFVRLKKRNGEDYKNRWVRYVDKEGYGTGYEYPNPDSVDMDSKKTAFTTFDLQTHFIVNRKNQTYIPFIIRYYYNYRVQLIAKERLDPITLFPLKPELQVADMMDH
jgi:hypothetical protein